MKFLIDAHLATALAEWIKRQGLDAAHVADVGLLSAIDTEIWKYSIVTKDQDFFQRRVAVKNGPQIVWLRLSNMRTRVLLESLATVFPAIISALEKQETVVEIR